MDMKPYVLVTNDDGIDSPGLHALIGALKPFCDLLVAAPRYQQTNMGRGALYGEEIGSIDSRMLDIDGHLVVGYAVNGSPAQTVAHAVLELADRKVDFCVSGINYGENLGLAITCSGTLGAAFEADSFGIPSMAFSRAVPLEHQRSENFNDFDWQFQKKHVRKIFNDVVRHGMAKNARILNVNFPSLTELDTEARITKQAYMNYGSYIRPYRIDFSKGCTLGWARNDKLHDVGKDTDIYAVHFDKVISITLLNPIMSVDAERYHR